MARHGYRSGMGILGDILDAAADRGTGGAYVSQISRRANISHCAVVEKCGRLEEAGLVAVRREKNRRAYLVTEAGLHFRREFNEFREMVAAMELRH
ncbi:MAG: transcriptional regulator [Nitrosopumilus sp.]|nr:transcriptional regulator [Nitrosopumilus sp.]MDA7958336.1 transcriptional regulator [Nitrosopumilus sp.]MDA7959393.1 transcriptional regulator [Nitrosopumilus sp.]